MGYYIEMVDNNFEIKKENFEKALEGLKSVFVPENMNCSDYIDGKRYPHFSWVDTHSVLRSRTLGEALEEIRYEPVYDSNGNICNVEFTGQKYGSENVFFNALAPYVESGSYIAFEGEDGDTWEWQFENGKAEQVNTCKDVKEIKEVMNDIKWLLKEAEQNSNNSAYGYDEGWYNGECNAYEIVLEKLENIVKGNN